MNPCLLDVNLQQVPDPYLHGSWRVLSHAALRTCKLAEPALFRQLHLAIEIVTALVTRLRRPADCKYRTSVRYLQSGLELFLVHP